MIALLIFAVMVGGILDDDNVLIFEWVPASGNVEYYNVYFSVDDGEPYLAGQSTSCKIARYFDQIGSKVVVYVVAVDRLGDAGPMSVGSEPLWRVMKRQPRQARSQ